MSGYGSMQASPFWKWVMRITGILCFVTLMTPPAYYLKYLVFDRSAEAAAKAQTASADPPLQFQYVELERSRAELAPMPEQRIQAVEWLKYLVLSPQAQITHPVECLFAKATLGQVASKDDDPAVQTAANDALVKVASQGAVIKR